MDGRPSGRLSLALVLGATLLAVGGTVGAHAAATPKKCIGAEEARVHARPSGESGPPSFSPAFYRHLFTLDTSLDGIDGKELPISIEQICEVPRKLATQAAQLVGNDGVALLLARTQVWDGGKRLSGAAAATALDGADTAAIRVRLTRPRSWRRDEDGGPVPTFRAGRIEITD
jgi:hypothetical protein